MAYLGKYIRQMLSKKEAVILPGLGSLLIREGKGASSASGTLEPPGIVVAFDAEHPLDDGRLADVYAEGENLEREEARQQVLELVDAIKFKLDKGETYKLELVGEFSRDQDNRIHFRKDPNWVIDPDLFGLASLDLLELEETPAEPQEQPTPAVEPQPAAKKEVQPATPVQKKKKVMAQRAPVNKWKIIWIVVASLIVVLLAILLIPGNQEVEFNRNGFVFRDSSSTQQQQPIDRPADADSEHTGLETETPGNQQSGQEQVQAETENRYFIIAGSFQGLQNATVLLDELKAKGFPAQMIITENRMYRVAISAYPTKQEALDALPGIKQRSGLQGCWVLSR